MPEVAPGIADAMKKAAVVWITVPGRDAVAAWLGWTGEVAYLLTGPGEQALPGLADATTCQVTAVTFRAAELAHALTWVASVRRVSPDEQEWGPATTLLLTKRLNLPDQPTAVRRWAAECAVLRLEPTGETVDPGADDHRAPPRPTPATTPVRIPYTFRLRRKRPRGRDQQPGREQPGARSPSPREHPDRGQPGRSAR